MMDDFELTLEDQRGILSRDQFLLISGPETQQKLILDGIHRELCDPIQSNNLDVEREYFHFWYPILCGVAHQMETSRDIRLKIMEIFTDYMALAKTFDDLKRPVSLSSMFGYLERRYRFDLKDGELTKIVMKCWDRLQELMCIATD